MFTQNETSWVERKVRQILRESGPRSARRFLDSRGGAMRYESSSREIARHVLATATKQRGGVKSSPGNQVLR